MNVWVEAARPKTLPAAVAPVLVGAAVADRFIWWRFVAALLVALALQIAVNFANDLFDAEGGVDTEARLGPRRVVAAGLVAPVAMQRAFVAALAVAAVAGLALAAVVGWELVLVGLLAMVGAYGYSGGRRPYASQALGEVAVFLFFGLVATVGTQYVLDEAWSWLAVLAGVPVGLLAAALLVVNNLRDIPTDAPAGKRTLAVVLGDVRTRALFGVLVAGAFLLDLALAVATSSGWPVLGLAGLPLGLRAVRVVRRGAEGGRLVGVLELTGRAHLLHGVGLAVGLALAAS